MIFILYSHIDQTKIDSSLGLPEYSYYFVLKEFREALEQIGTVVIVTDPRVEVDAISTGAKARGEACVYISFSPPNKALVDLPCPSLCVFAWEFDRIPDESWDDDPRNDWRYVLARHGRTIALSQDSAEAVRAAMGKDFPVAAIPVPVWDRFAHVHQRINRLPVIEATEIAVAGNIIDSNLYRISAETISLEQPERCFSTPAWDQQVINMEFQQGGSGSGNLVGFYESEPSWGTWSKVEEPWILLPAQVNGSIQVVFNTCAYGANIDRNVYVKIGDQCRMITLTKDFSSHKLQFDLRQAASSFRILGLDLSPQLNALDPRTMGVGVKSLSIERLEPDTSIASVGAGAASERGQGDSENEINLEFTGSVPDGCSLVGFYQAENWGVWSRAVNPWIFFPREFSGQLTLELCARAYGANVGREIRVVMGGQSRAITLQGAPETYTLKFNPDLPVESLRFEGLEARQLDVVADVRTMGIGLTSLKITGLEDTVKLRPVSQYRETLATSISGVVYTSVFNPGDDRKNWLDMLTAFVFAFRDVEDATLVLKMTHHSLSSYLGHFHYYVQRLAPFKCRVLIIHGFLADDAYETLIAASSYYVNTSRCEGLCLPLMEFMACGKPGIAPLHTAMRDYVAEDSNFIIDSSVEPGIWPHDPRDVFRALRYRLSWASLVECYQESYRIAKQDVPRYQAMSSRGIARIKGFCSHEIVKSKLADFLHIETGG